MSLTPEVLEDVRRVIAAEGVKGLSVNDLVREDLAHLAWAGGPSRIAGVAKALERVATGEVEYLAVRAPNGQPIALGGIDYTEHEGAGTLWQLAAAVQGVGIGTQLIKTAEERIRHRGLRTAMLGVEDNNPRARKLYHRLGYRECGREKSSWEEHDARGLPFLYETELTLMKKDLGPRPVFTIGFARKSAERFFGALRDVGVERVVDIRLSNRSQLAGFTKREDLPYFLRELCGAEYLYEPLLAPTREILDGYRERGGGWESYEREFLDLLAGRGVEERLDPALLEPRTVLLCSEPTPEHCHRRLVAEYLQRHWHGLEITHL